MDIHESLVTALAAVTSVYGTDLVFTIDDPPMLRLDGRIRPVDGMDPVDGPRMNDYLRSLLSDDQRTELQNERDTDFAFSWNGFRFRGNAFYQRGVPAIALRNIQNTIPTFENVRSIPDAMPNMSGGAAFMISELLPGKNSDAPTAFTAPMTIALRVQT